MSEKADTAGVILPPPVILLIAVVAGITLRFIWPLPFLPGSFPRLVVGACIFVAAIGLAGWATGTMRRAGTRYETSQPTSAIVAAGPYRFTRNPIYVAMMLLLAALAVASDNAWLALVAIPFCLVIYFGVIAREEIYLERKFGADYLAHKSAVRRWL